MIAKAIRGDDFYGLLAYLIRDRNLHPDAIRLSQNLLSRETAAKEMTVVARGNRRCIQPVRHIILGWHEDERPSIEQQHACAEALLDRLGVASHQNIRVVHIEDKTTAQASGDGRHYELHIAVNGVGPTGKAPESTRDWSTIEIATAWVAAEHGFAEIPGRFNGVGAGPESSKNGKARSVAAQNEKPTIADELSANPIRLQRLVKARARGMEAGSWDALLEELDRQGLSVERGKDRGSQRVRGLILVDKTDPKRRQKFSALDTPVLKWGEGPLTTDLGSVPPDLSVNAATARKGADMPTVEAESSADAAPRPNDLEREIERRMRHERSTLRRQFKEEQDRIHQERSRILTVKKGAWRKFQGRRAELLNAARTRRNLLYWILPKRRLLRKLLNTRFDRTLNIKLQAARGVFDDEKALPLPDLQCWTTWSASQLRAARTRIQQELLAEAMEAAAKQSGATGRSDRAEPPPSESRQGFTAAGQPSPGSTSALSSFAAWSRARMQRLHLKRNNEAQRAKRRHLAANYDFIRKYWDAAADNDPIAVRWNATARPSATVASMYLVNGLRAAGVVLTGKPGEDLVYVSMDDLSDWIGTGRGRDDRLAIVERAAASSRREADAVRAEEEEARKAVEQERKHRADEARRRITAGVRDVIQESWALDPELDHVIIRWSSSRRSAETAPSVSLVKELEASGVSLGDVVGAEAVSVSVSALTDWIRTGSDRLGRLELVERAATSSRREADAVRADEDEAERRAAEQERKRRAEEVRQRDLAENLGLIRTYWALDPELDHVVIRWSSGTRSTATIPSISLIQNLGTSGVPLEDVAGAEAVSVSVLALANWIGTDGDRVARLLMVNQAAASSRREADAVRADKEEEARQRYLSESRDLIRTYWFAAPSSDRVAIRWNSKTRSAETAPARQLVDSLQAAGIRLAPGLLDEARIVSIADLAAWIGTQDNRADRLLQVERAAASSRREADAVRADKEEEARQRYLSESRDLIRTYWFAAPSSDRVAIRWNSKTRSAETAPARQLVDSLQAAGIRLAPGLLDEARIVSIADLAAWIGTQDNRADRLLQVERAAASSRREADAVRADKEEEARQRYLSESRDLIRTYWFAAPSSDRVAIRWNSKTRSAETAPARQLVDSLQAAGIRLAPGLLDEARIVSIADLAAWIGTQDNRADRLLQVERAAASSRREADAVRADKEEEARQRYLSENRDLIRTYWFAGSTSGGDRVAIRWNSTTRRDETSPSKHLVGSMEAAGVPLINGPSEEIKYVLIADLAAWIGIQSNRANRLLQVEQAADASKRENDIVRTEWRAIAKKRADDDAEKARQRPGLDEVPAPPPVQIISWPNQVKEVLGARDGAIKVTLFAGPKRQAGAVHAFYDAAHKLQLGGAYPGPPSQGDCFIVEIWKFGNSIQTLAQKSTAMAAGMIRLLQAARDEHAAAIAAKKPKVAPSETKKPYLGRPSNDRSEPDR